MITLYYDPLSVCCQKVLLTLAELGTQWQGKYINLFNGEQHSESYLAINPHAQVPTLIDDGWTITESSVICEYLTNIAATNTLNPENAKERAEMQYWAYRVPQQLHAACGFITYAVVARPLQLTQPREEVLSIINKIPDPAVRRSRLICFEQGVESGEFQEALQLHSSLFTEVDRVLRRRQWLTGENYTLADAALFPYLLRLEHLSMTTLFESLSGLERWYDDCKARESYKIAIETNVPQDFITISKQAGQAVAGSIRY